MNRKTGILVFLLSILIGNADAKSDDAGWVFSPVVGVNRLALNVFYDTVYNAPFVGTVRITTDLPEDVEGDSSYPTKEFHFENNLKARPFDVEAGLEIRRKFGTQNDFYIGIGAWETLAEANESQVIFPLQGQANNSATFNRRSKLSYTQYYLGISHYLNKRSKKLNAYVNLSLREVFDIDYTETNVFEFTSGAPAGFKRIFIFRSQATGFLMFQFGVGAEYHFADRFSIALEGAYALHMKAGALKGVNISNDYNEGDGITSEPLIIKPINSLLEAGALDEDGIDENRQKVELRFDGWHLLAKFNIEF